MRSLGSVRFLPLSWALVLLAGSSALATAYRMMAATAPTDVQLPGTQPQEVPPLTTSIQCDNCHGNYNPLVEPAHNWRGGMMAQASRDPLFWAAMAISEQDFDGAGDLCLRCHVPMGWLDGRSTPTDGSQLFASDAEGVTCHLCHRLTNPDGSEHLGVQNPPYVANDGGNPVEGYYGSGMAVLNYDDVRLGPYTDATAPHAFAQSHLHRKSELCGTCHDVSNPVVGDLAPGNGTQELALQAGTYSGVPGAPVDQKAAFNNPPYRYGVVERTFSEAKASLLEGTPIADYALLPTELQGGSIEAAYLAATDVRPDGNYADGSLRTFDCQSCHMPPVLGKGCKQGGAPVRADLPLHDQTGANVWAPDAIAYLDSLGRLRLGGGLTTEELAALADGKVRARTNLELAAGLEVIGDGVRVVNRTGHKLFTGYPEGRRMWLNVRWYDAFGLPLREDGAYGPVDVLHEGAPLTVETLLDAGGAYSHVWQAKFGMSQEWAAQLVAWGWPGTLPLDYDRFDGSIGATLADLAAAPAGTLHETFHFALNNVVIADNRIPPYGLSYDQSVVRNTLPIPKTLFGAPGPGGTYEHWDLVPLDPPDGAATAEIALYYQTTSWEYVQFLDLANDGLSAFLGQVGNDLLEAWLATGMASPVLMASVTWTAPFIDCNQNGVDDATDIANGTSKDCNTNGIPDECDIAAGTSSDINHNWIPDECEHFRVPFRRW